MTEPAGNLLPIYFVADHSGSMDLYIDDLNQAIRDLLETMRYESFAATKVRFSIIGFNAGAGVVLPPMDLRYVEEVPQFEAYGMTSFSVMLDLLADQIPVDVAALKAERYRVYRPAVFLMTDGYPTDEEHEWRGALERLNAIPARPTMLTFGIGDALDEVLVALASPNLAHRYDGHGSPADGLKSVITSLTNSVVQSGNAMADTAVAPQLHFEPPTDFIRIDIDEV